MIQHIDRKNCHFNSEFFWICWGTEVNEIVVRYVEKSCFGAIQLKIKLFLATKIRKDSALNRDNIIEGILAQTSGDVACKCNQGLDCVWCYRNTCCSAGFNNCCEGKSWLRGGYGQIERIVIKSGRDCHNMISNIIYSVCVGWITCACTLCDCDNWGSRWTGQCFGVPTCWYLSCDDWGVTDWPDQRRIGNCVWLIL
jgi:hypothetical protein